MDLFNFLLLRRRRESSCSSGPAILLPALLSILLFSCKSFRLFQVHPQKKVYPKPFVYSTNIKVEGNIPAGEKKDLALRLSNQLDDSLRTQIVSYAGIYRKLVDAPSFDTLNIRRSIAFMVASLNSSGYYTPIIKDTFYTRLVRKHPHSKDQYRVSIIFRVLPGKQLRLDSIGFDLQTPALEALALQSRGKSLLKKGNPYSKTDLSAELDRLVALFRDNGYYKFTKDDLFIERDTVVAGLIDPTLDPFQQAALLEELRRKREHPTINVVVRQRPVKDSGRIMQYYIGHVTVYPDLPILEDTATVSTIDTSAAKGFTIISEYDKFKNSFIVRNIYLRPGRMYQQSRYDRTLNRFNSMGAWQQANGSFLPSDRSDSVLDFILKLYPNKKQYLNADLEASRNTNDILTTGNLFGVGVNFGLRNRNTFKQSVLSSTSLRGGVELGDDFIQTTQASISHTISFPRMIAPFITQRRKQDSIRTILNANASYTDRRQFFTAKTFNVSWGYQWSRGYHSFLWTPLNIEYTRLDKTDSFQHYLDSIPSLNLAFKSGLVIGQQFAYSYTKKTGIHTNFLQITAEESGATLGFIKKWDEGDLWRFVKGDVTYRHHIDYRRTELAMRAYAGAGIAYGREGSGWEQTLPFYKAFFAGGPNSMRAWQIRQLGLGSSKYYDTGAASKLIDRFGDIQLEGNIEYRFPLGTLFGVKLKSALYMDAGNIWDRHNIDSADHGSDFQLNRFFKEIAVDAGTGLRLDFDYFLIRFDWAYKLRDPQSLEGSDQWFYKLRLGSGQFQLGINYPF